MKNLSTFFLAMSLIFFSSCATLFTGTKDKITFKSTPPGATVLIDGVEHCTTPCTTDVKRNTKDTAVEFKLDGYETKIIILSKDFNYVSILNLGNLPFWGIDYLSGAVMEYDKKNYDVKLLDTKKHP